MDDEEIDMRPAKHRNRYKDPVDDEEDQEQDLE